MTRRYVAEYAERHARKVLRDWVSETTGRPLRPLFARYPGRCYECGQAIDPGQGIRVTDTGYVHAGHLPGTCPDDGTPVAADGICHTCGQIHREGEGA